ncbi:MAG: zinc ribbon domain-containing protein [Coprococcus sp.]|nr:zinc ribbon domain-containing protein [Coprococcus sp.]
MFCKHCGANLPDGVKFCPSCGKPTVSPGAAPTPGAGPGPNPPVNNTAATPSGGFRPSPGPGPGTPGNGTPGPGAPKAPGNNLGGTSFIPNPAGFNVPTTKPKKTYNIGNFVLWGGCAVAVLSLFLPYCSASAFGFSQSISLMDADTGMYFLGIIGIIAVLNIFKLNILCIIGSIFNLCLIFYGHSYVQEEVGILVDFEIGNTLLYLGGFVMIGASVAALVLWNKMKKAV